VERYLAAGVQMSSGPDRATNLARATALVRAAAARGAQLVVLPEVFAWRGRREDEASAAEPSQTAARQRPPQTPSTRATGVDTSAKDMTSMLQCSGPVP